MGRTLVVYLRLTSGFSDSSQLLGSQGRRSSLDGCDQRGFMLSLEVWSSCVSSSERGDKRHTKKEKLYLPNGTSPLTQQYAKRVEKVK